MVGTCAVSVASASASSGVPAATSWLCSSSTWADAAAAEAAPAAAADGVAVVTGLLVPADGVVRLGVVVPLEDGRLRIESPSLLRAGLQVVALGIPPDKVVAAQLAEAYAKTGTTSLTDTVLLCDVAHDDLHLGGKTLRLKDGRRLSPSGWTTGAAA